MNRVRGFVARRLRPFEHVTIHSQPDMEAHAPHFLQLFKRLRYRAFLQRVYKPTNDIDRVAYEKQLKRLLPQPVAIALWVCFGYLYCYPFALTVGILLGATRGPLMGNAKAESMAEPEALKWIQRAMDNGAAVQVAGERSSDLVRLAALRLPRRTLYVDLKGENIKKPIDGETYPTCLIAQRFGLLNPQVTVMLWAMGLLKVTPVVVFDVNSTSLVDWLMRKDMGVVSRQPRNRYDIVYSNKDPFFTTQAITQPISDDSIVAILTDAKTPERAVKAASADLKRAVIGNSTGVFVQPQAPTPTPAA